MRTLILKCPALAGYNLWTIYQFFIKTAITGKLLTDRAPSRLLAGYLGGEGFVQAIFPPKDHTDVAPRKPGL